MTGAGLSLLYASSMAVAAGRLGAAIRDEFPIFAHTTYLNSCSQGALSHRVRAAYEEYLDGWDENGADWAHWVERAEAARAAFGRLLRADPAEVAVTTSVTQGVNGIVSALPLERGGRTRIVISEYEFPTVGQIAHAQELRGAEVVHVPPGGRRIDPARALRRGDRRAHGSRLLHHRLLPDRVTGTTSPRSRAWLTTPGRSVSPTRTRRSARSTSTPARSASTSSPAAR